jgi:hypothetical protein
VEEKEEEQKEEGKEGNKEIYSESKRKVLEFEEGKNGR